MVGKLRTNEDGFNELGIATRNANGEMLSTEEIFWNAANALSAMENETERDIAAQELFGKSAAELAGILDDGGKAFREIGDEASLIGCFSLQKTFLISCDVVWSVIYLAQQIQIFGGNYCEKISGTGF